MSCPLCGKRLCDHTAEQRGQTVEEMIDEVADLFFHQQEGDKKDSQVQMEDKGIIGKEGVIIKDE